MPGGQTGSATRRALEDSWVEQSGKKAPIGAFFFLYRRAAGQSASVRRYVIVETVRASLERVCNGDRTVLDRVFMRHYSDCEAVQDTPVALTTGTPLSLHCHRPTIKWLSTSSVRDSAG